MRDLFRSGAVFFIIAGISFVLAAAKYLMTESGSTVTSGGLVANGAVMLVLGMVIRSRNTRWANGGLSIAIGSTEIRRASWI